jgi:hypothetical protein
MFVFKIKADLFAKIERVMEKVCCFTDLVVLLLSKHLTWAQELGSQDTTSQ